MTSSVVSTLHSDDGHRCVKIMRASDGTFGIREFRRDPEDAGGWTIVRGDGGAFATPQEAVAAAAQAIAWFGAMQSNRPEVPPRTE